jgi:hypothetical protein
MKVIESKHMKPHLDFKRSLYRYAFPLALFLLPMGAKALDLSPNVSRVISDPSYLPLRGQLYGSTEYSYGNTGSNSNNYLNTLTSSNSTVSNTIIQELAYSLTDDFTLRVSDSYEWLTSTTTGTSGATTVTNSNGLLDPTFGATWRVLDESQHFFNWDLIGSYAPNLINAQSASPSNNGNLARGGDTETLGTALSYKSQDFTLYLEGSTTYLDNRYVVNPATNITTTYTSSWQYYLLVSTQTRFTNQWSVNLALSQTFNNIVNASYTNGGGTLIASSRNPGNATDLIGALNFQAVPDRFVISAIYNHNFYNIGGTTYAALPASNTTTFNKGEDVFSGELRYVFN